jgi:hypothetical protein
LGLVRSSFAFVSLRWVVSMSAPERESAHPRVDDWLDEDRIEYEVEPPDADVDKSRELHGRQIVADAMQRAECDDGWYHAQPWEANLSWRFSLRDLFAVMAIVAISLTVFRLGGPCPATVIGGLGTFFWLLIYLERIDPNVTSPRDAGQLPDDSPQLRKLPPLRLSYSTSDLLVAMTIAAVCFSLLKLFRPPLAAATLGFFVLAGIVLYWLGATLPRRAVLAWFLLTAMYLVVSTIAVIGDAG